MALTDGFIAVTLGIIFLYYFFYRHEVRWMRMVGCFAIMIVAIGLGVVEDTIPMLIFALVNIMIAGLKFILDVGDILGIFNEKKLKIRVFR